jgi:hypothetical protein
MGPAQGVVMAGDTINFSAWMRAADIQSSISSCGALFNSGIFNAGATAGVVFEASVTLLLIHLNDLLQKAKIDGKRVSFTDDVTVSDAIRDVTDVVRACRNAACHVTSGEHKIDAGKFTFCTAAGYNPTAFTIKGVEMGCGYHDDIAVYYGPTRVYLRRHLLRSFEEIARIYKEETRW